MTEISIIIPVYNTEKYLGKCIDSILESENAPEYEIIFINDGSTDSSGEILDDYSVHHDNIRIYTIENSGAAAARNYGIQRAVGKYIVFIDSDDTIASNCLELLYDAISLNDADMVQIGEEIKGFPNETRITCGKNDAIKFFARGKVFSGTIWSKIYKRSSVQSLVMVGGLAEDQMFILDVLSNNYKFVSIGGGTVYNYRLNESSITHSSFSEFQLSFVDFLKRLYDVILVIDPDYSDNVKARYITKVWTYYCLSLHFKYDNWKLHANEYIRILKNERNWIKNSKINFLLKADILLTTWFPNVIGLLNGIAISFVRDRRNRIN